MKEADPLFGAKAKIAISYDGGLRELARYLGDRLFLVEFWFDTEMDPPHGEFAMCEALGFSIWLYPLKEKKGFKFELSFETDHAHKEIMNDRMHDLSPWFARFVYEIGRLKAEVC